VIEWKYINLIYLWLSSAIYIWLYTVLSPKINLWSDWWCLLGVSNQTIVILVFNMLLVKIKSFFRSQKGLRLIYFWSSVALWIWLVIYFKQKNNLCSHWWCLLHVSSQTFLIVMFASYFKPKLCYNHFWYVIGEWKIIIQKLKRLHYHSLMSFSNIMNMASYIFLWQKTTFVVSGVFALYFCFEKSK